MSDVFEQLRPVADPAPPDPGFVARLRARVAAALDDAGRRPPTIDLPERTTTMTDIDDRPRRHRDDDPLHLRRRRGRRR